MKETEFKMVKLYNNHMQKSEPQLRSIQLQTQTLLTVLPLPFGHREASSQKLDKEVVLVPHKIHI